MILVGVNPHKSFCQEQRYESHFSMQNTREYVCWGMGFGTDSSGVCVWLSPLLSAAGEVHLVQLEGSDVMIRSVPVLELDAARRWITSPTSLKSKNKTQQSDFFKQIFISHCVRVESSSYWLAGQKPEPLPAHVFAWHETIFITTLKNAGASSPKNHKHIFLISPSVFYSSEFLFCPQTQSLMVLCLCCYYTLYKKCENQIKISIFFTRLHT